MKKRRFDMRVQSDLHKDATALAVRKGISLTALVTLLLTEAVERDRLERERKLLDAEQI